MASTVDRLLETSNPGGIITGLTNLEFVYSFQVLREDSEKIEGGERWRNHYCVFSFKCAVNSL